jgi:hypothetical protein
MNYDNIAASKAMVRTVIRDRLPERDIDTIMSYLEIAYVKGRIDELKSLDRQLEVVAPAEGGNGAVDVSY